MIISLVSLWLFWNAASKNEMTLQPCVSSLPGVDFFMQVPFEFNPGPPEARRGFALNENVVRRRDRRYSNSSQRGDARAHS